MKQKHNGGYSLIEILVAITVLGIVMVPTCTALLMSLRINGRTEQMLQAQLAVSSAVETLMAEGISGEAEDYGWIEVDGVQIDLYPDVKIKTVDMGNHFEVTATSDDALVSVTTCIRKDGGDE